MCVTNMPSLLLMSTRGLSVTTVQTLHGGLIRRFDLYPRLSSRTPGLAAVGAISVSLRAGHSGYTKHSRRSCSSCTRTAGPAPPSRSYAVCPGSFHLQLVGCRVSCCSFAPVRVWCLRHSPGCALCPALGTAPPSSVSLFRRSVSTRSTPS